MVINMVFPNLSMGVQANDYIIIDDNIVDNGLMNTILHTQLPVMSAGKQVGQLVHLSLAKRNYKHNIGFVMIIIWKKVNIHIRLLLLV